jgi:hypothetical protein
MYNSSGGIKDRIIALNNAASTAKGIKFTVFVVLSFKKG